MRAVNRKFVNRTEAGKQLGEQLLAYRNSGALVIALPRGGVPVAHEVAKKLQLPMYVFIVRKIGAPGNKEYAIGAISETGIVLLDNHAISELSISQQNLDELIQHEEHEITRRIHTYRMGKPFPDVSGKTVIIVDDGLATGYTARASIQSLKQKGVADIIFASPVSAHDTAEQLKEEVSDMQSIISPQQLRAVGQYYENFQPVKDAEVREILTSHKYI